MKNVLLFLLFLYCCTPAKAQNTDTLSAIKGSLIDSAANKPVAYATLVLQDGITGLPIKSTLSKEDGRFQFSGIAAKEYQLVCACVGYASKTLPLTTGKGETDLGKISLFATGKQLKEVVVTSVRPVIKRGIDGISYDVGADPESAALSVLDIMRKVPLLSLDAADNISLKGSGNYKILINGRESALIAKNPSDILRSMPAANIEKIEVITTPPARYDAEGLAGIINIITKKRTDQGYTIGMNTLYNSIGGPVVNLNGTLKQAKFGMSAFGGYSRHIPQTDPFGFSQTFLADQSTLSQAGGNTFSGHDDYGNMELSYEFDSLNLITASFNIADGINIQNSGELTVTQNEAGGITQQYQLANTGNSHYKGMDATVNYQLGFKKDKNRLLTLSYKYNYSPNSLFNQNSFSDTLNYNQPDYRQTNTAGNRESTIQVDYIRPFKTVTVEAGGKTIVRNNYSNFQTSAYDDTTKQYVLNPAQTNDFNYHQYIYSLYNSYQAKWSKWTVKGGIRLEHTAINADFESVGSSVDQQYDNLIPSLLLQRSFKTSSLGLGYTDRIGRPGIYQLNPFVDRTNPKFITTGNPGLQPELNHSLELNYSNFAKSAINIGLDYAFSKSSIQNVTSLEIDNTANNTHDTVTLTTYRNLGTNSRLGLNINTNFTIIKDLSASINGQVTHVWLSGYYSSDFYRNQGYTGGIFFNGAYKINDNYRVSTDGGIYTGDVYLQGKARGMFWSSYVLTRSFSKNRASLSLVSYNPYDKYWNLSAHSATPDFHQSSYNLYPYRSFVVRFNIKFGRLNSEIRKNQKGINNDDKAGKGGS
ncbi:MAG: TonB-dependent receptor [Puia sp.]|nr:TonB-dependent receptor [Puia sp.]